MFTKTSTISIAIIALSSNAIAGTGVFWTVPERAVENVPHDHKLTATEQMHVTVHEDILDRRDTELDRARSDRALARDGRKAARREYRDARKDLRKARRKGFAVMSATSKYTAAERSMLEADDYVDLQKERVRAKRERVDLALRTVRSANAELELAESRLVAGHGGGMSFLFKPKRFEKQLDHRLSRERKARSDYRRALVDVREARQDHYDPFAKKFTYSVPVEYLNPHLHTPTPVSTAMTETGSNEIWTGEPMELRRVRFDLGSSSLDTDALNDLAWNAHVLRTNRDATVEVEGHTDATGTYAFNRDLAWDRADAAAEFLLENGVWDEQIETVAYGEMIPLVETASATEINRRTEFRVLEDPDGLVDGTLDDSIDWVDSDMDR